MINQEACTIPHQFTAWDDVVLRPCVERMVCGIARRGTAVVGIRAVDAHDETRDEAQQVTVHYLLSFNVRVPRIGYAREDFTRFIYEADDDMLSELRIDDRDGEVYLILAFQNDPAAAIERLNRYLDHAECLRAQVRDYVGAHIERTRQEAM